MSFPFHLESIPRSYLFPIQSFFEITDPIVRAQLMQNRVPPDRFVRELNDCLYHIYMRLMRLTLFAVFFTTCFISFYWMMIDDGVKPYSSDQSVFGMIVIVFYLLYFVLSLRTWYTRSKVLFIGTLIVIQVKYPQCRIKMSSFGLFRQTIDVILNAPAAINLDVNETVQRVIEETVMQICHPEVELEPREGGEPLPRYENDLPAYKKSQPELLKPEATLERKESQNSDSGMLPE